MGDLDTLAGITGLAGLGEEQFVNKPKTKAANQAQFDTAEGRGADLRTNVLGNPKLQGVPQDLIDLARESGGSIIKRPNGSFYVTGQGQGQFQPGSVNLGKPGRGPDAFEISRTGVQGFEDLKTDVLGSFDDLQSSVLGGIDDRTESILGNFGDLEGRLNTQAQGRTETGMALINKLMGELQGGFGTLRGDLLGALEGSGDQERIDINETFDNRGDAIQAGLISSGLSGSTILPSLQTDIARQRTGEQGRLEERLRQQELGIIGDTGFGALNAQQGLGQFGAGLFSNLSGDALDLSSLLGVGGIGLQQDLSGERLGAEERLGTLGIGLEQGLGADAINAGVNFGQIPFNFDIGLTGSEQAIDFSQMTEQGVAFFTQLANLFASSSQPDTPKQSSSFENIFTGAFG